MSLNQSKSSRNKPNAPGKMKENGEGKKESERNKIVFNMPLPEEPRSSVVIASTKFTVHPKYRLIRPIGHGAYGVVCSSQNQETGEYVAIKKITNMFNNSIETKRAMREVQLLRKLRHENVIGLIDLMITQGSADLYLVSELMDSDLHQIIVSKQHLSNDHIQYFVYQILRGLLFIHSANVIHRDLKPSNILVNANCDIKICDFGLARPVDSDVSEEGRRAFMTEYVATRWYRAPEIMLSWKEYGFAIDVWAVGCILAELLGRMPLFPGQDYMDQLRRTLKVTGKPCLDDIAHIRSERARAWVRNFPETKRANWQRLYPKADNLALQLLDAMLTFSPKRRITVAQALRHPYLEQLHDPQDEPIADFKFDMKFEKQFQTNMTQFQIQNILLRELQWFREFQKQRTAYFRQMNIERKLQSEKKEDKDSVIKVKHNRSEESGKFIQSKESQEDTHMKESICSAQEDMEMMDKSMPSYQSSQREPMDVDP